MRLEKTALLIGLSAALAQPALAGGMSETCDWYENAVVGTRCAHSWSVNLSAEYLNYGYQGVGANPTKSSTDEYDYLTGTLAVTPTSWLTLSYGSEFVSENHNWTHNGTPYSFSNTWAGAQTLEANVNVVDTGPGSQRFVINTFFAGAITPSHVAGALNNQVDQNNAVFGGITANGQWRVGPGMSIVGEAQLEAASESLNNEVILYPHARLLLSSDKLGLAVGPVFNSGQLMSSSLSYATQNAYYYLGGTAIAQPFRSSNSAFLNGIMLQVTGQETLGQAGFVSPSIAKTDQYEVTGTVGFHFRY
jgi:hypothetical protein